MLRPREAPTLPPSFLPKLPPICLPRLLPNSRPIVPAALLATLFNLLPVLPMDGGRLAKYALETVMELRTADAVLRVTGTLCAIGVLSTGICIRSIAAAAAGIWMGALANFPALR